METISRYLLTFLLNSLWQVPLVAAVAALASRLMLNSPARYRHAVWVTALLAGIVLPLASVRKSEQSAPARITVTYASPTFTSVPSVSSAAAPAPARQAQAQSTLAVPLGQTTGSMLVGIYLLFLAFRFGKFGWSWMRTIQIRRTSSARNTPPALDNVWRRGLKAFDLNGVELLSSPIVSSPVMAGVWRKTIILPESLFAETSDDLLATAIGHEMAHIARYDFALNLLYELMYLAVSFHPAAWIIRREIERTREMACDELVTRQLIDPGVYARSIMKIAVAMVELPHPGCTLGVFDGDILEERIRRLIAKPAANLKRARVLLAAGLSALALCAAIASGLVLTARAQAGAQGEMKQAGEAYNSGDFKSAVHHFENAVTLEPANINAKLFLANALIRQFFEEGAQPDSVLMAEARRQYQDVLSRDAQNKLAMQGVAAVAMDTKQFSEAHDWALKLIQLDPKDKTAYYTAGVLDWVIIYPEFVRAKEAAGGKMEEYWIPDAVSRKSLRDQFLPRIEDGFRMLQIALQLDPKYDDAMAYMNLLDRLKAGIVDSPAESADLIAKADDWVTKTLATKRLKAQSHKPEAAPRLNVDGPPPGPASAEAVLAVPPPPPPPPAIADNQTVSASPLPEPRNAAEWAGSFWQVTGGAGTVNALTRLLKENGFHAVALASAEDNQVRVMVGPYSDARSLDRAKTSLQGAGFHPVRIWENGHQ